MKEKLQFVERDNSSLTGELADVDDQLAGQRGALTALKATRDVMRTKQRSFKDTTLNITNPQLLRDMEVGGCGRVCVTQRGGSLSAGVRRRDSNQGCSAGVGQHAGCTGQQCSIQEGMPAGGHDGTAAGVLSALVQAWSLMHTM